jgi:hypothetical protein
MLEGPARLVFVGIDAVRHRQSGARLDDEGRKKELEDEVKTWLPAESEVKITKQPNWNDVEANLTVDMTISTPMLTSAGKRVLLPSQVFHTVDKAVFPHAQRINGVYMYFPSREVDQVTLILPPQFAVESLPQKEVVQLEYAMYSNQAKQEADKIELSRDLAMAEFVFPVNKYGEVKGFYDKVKTNDDQQIVLRSAANAVSGN